MCSFIILLLLLSRNSGNCGCNNGYNAGNYDRRNKYSRSDNENYRRNNDEKCHKDDDEDYYRDVNDDYHRGKDRDCGCSACEDGSHADASPIVEREDIWTSYKNTSAGKPCK